VQIIGLSIVLLCWERHSLTAADVCKKIALLQLMFAETVLAHDSTFVEESIRAKGMSLRSAGL
jgi:hypothetical protein